MKKFSQIAFEPNLCKKQVSEFQQLLKSDRFLPERDKILPFF